MRWLAASRGSASGECQGHPGDAAANNAVQKVNIPGSFSAWIDKLRELVATYAGEVLIEVAPGLVRINALRAAPELLGLHCERTSASAYARDLKKLEKAEQHAQLMLEMRAHEARARFNSLSTALYNEPEPLQDQLANMLLAARVGVRVEYRKADGTPGDATIEKIEVRGGKGLLCCLDRSGRRITVGIRQLLMDVDRLLRTGDTQ